MNFNAILDAPDATPTADAVTDATPGTDDTSSSSTDTSTGDSTDPNAVTDETAGDDGQGDLNADATAGDDTPAVDAITGDGRTIPAKWKELFKSDKELKSLYFATAEFRKHFETPEKAKEFLADLEAAGGIEGLRQASTMLQEIDTAVRQCAVASRMG